MKRPKISEAISPLTKSRHSAKTPAAALLGSRPPRQNTIFTSRSSSPSATVFQRIVASILNYGGSNAPASLILSAEFLPGVHPANNLLNLSTTEPTL